MNDLSKNEPYDVEWTMDPHGAKDFIITDDAGKMHVGGCLPRKWLPEASPFKPWGSDATVPMVPKSEWVDGETLRVYQRETVDQNGYPKCCLSAAKSAMQLAMVRDGRPFVSLDDQKPWKDLSGGRGGVALDDALAYAMDKGFPRLDGKGTVKIAEAWDCPSVEALASALQRGAICTYGAQVHAQCMTRLVKRNGVWCGDVVNSWGQFGEAGGPNNEFWGWHFVPLSEVEMRYSIIAIREVEIIADGEWRDAV
jgi:hypothetical protein